MTGHAQGFFVHALFLLWTCGERRARAARSGGRGITLRTACVELSVEERLDVGVFD